MINILPTLGHTHYLLGRCCWFFQIHVQKNSTSHNAKTNKYLPNASKKDLFDRLHYMRGLSYDLKTASFGWNEKKTNYEPVAIHILLFSKDKQKMELATLKGSKISESSKIFDALNNLNFSHALRINNFSAPRMVNILKKRKIGCKIKRQPWQYLNRLHILEINE